jgi:hypothetical protein
MRARVARLVWIALLAVPALALRCNPVPTIKITSPTAQEQVNACLVSFSFDLVGAFTGPPRVTLNFAPLAAPLTEGPAGTFTASLGASDGLAADNILLVSADRASDGETLTQGVSFSWAPTASARVIADPADLVTGPLGHSRLGDYLLESCEARFVVQQGGQRDLYSVGQYGGNLIDAERRDRPGLDNFLEIAPMLNVETVVNPQSVVIVNDGADGNPAVVRACGPDDLLDFVNPSSQVTDAGLPFPPVLNDNDQTIEGCTDFSLGVHDSHVTMATTISNIGAAPVKVLYGDWLNPAGELDVMATPNAGVGAALTNDVGTMSFHGVGEAAGVDYAYTSTPPAGQPGSYVVISGVTVVLYNKNVLFALLGLVEGDEILPGSSLTMTRYVGVGDGTASSAVDLEVAIKGIPSARLDGCVTVSGMPAPGAKVTVGAFDASNALVDLTTHFTTDDAGCYAGDVPLPAGAAMLGVVAGRHGTPYEGGAATPPPTLVAFSPGGQYSADFDLPATGGLSVAVTDDAGQPLPARVTVVGFDPSPEVLIPGPSLPGFGGSTLAVLNDPGDSLPFGLVDAVYTGADGAATFDVEPGTYQVFVSRGTEYSTSDQPVTIVANAVTDVNAQIARVVDTSGFVSSDFHIHGINSADSRVAHVDRVEGYAGEGVDNIIMTDHHVHTDLDPTIAALGLGGWVSSTIGEEITTFDYGHFNAYPFTVDPTRVSGGSTDWAVAAPPGMEFPSAGAYNATPAEIYALATSGATSTPDTTIQVNHIGSHFSPLKIDTSLVPPQDALDAAGRAERRLDEPVTTNLFFPFPALELWNGHTRGAQSEFLDDRIGIWFNLLNQGIETTFIADTDSHRFTNLRSAGARTWTAAAPGSDTAGTVDDGEVANMVDAGRATGGQGVFVTTVLRATDGSGAAADLTRFGSTHVTDSAGDVELDIRIQAPTWAPFDRVEVYANAATVPVDAANPYAYGAVPTLVLDEGDCDPTTTGDGDFDVTTVNVVPAVAGAERLEANLTVPFSGLAQDTWFVVVVKGTDGECGPMFPVFAADLDSATNTTLADLLDGNVGESGVMALGATNALYFDAP